MAHPAWSLGKHFEGSRSPATARTLAHGCAPSPAQDQPHNHHEKPAPATPAAPRRKTAPSQSRSLCQGVLGGPRGCSPPKPEPGFPLPCQHGCSQLCAGKLPALL